VQADELRVDIGVLAGLVLGDIQASHRAGLAALQGIAVDHSYLVAINSDRAADVPDRNMSLGHVAGVLRDPALEPDLAVADDRRPRTAVAIASQPEGERSGNHRHEYGYPHDPAAPRGDQPPLRTRFARGIRAFYRHAHQTARAARGVHSVLTREAARLSPGLNSGRQAAQIGQFGHLNAITLRQPQAARIGGSSSPFPVWRSRRMT
jgi:hypothetical protein